MKRILLLFACICFWVGSFAQSYRLILPKSGFVFSTDSITFKWAVADSALSYDIQVATDTLFNNIAFSQAAIPVCKTQAALNSGFEYYWRMRVTTRHGTQGWSYYRYFYVFSPQQISGLSMWFDAAKNVVTTGSKVSQWSDLSPSNLVATQSSAGNMPSLTGSAAQLNNKPVIYFNGSNYLFHSTLSFTRYTALIVRDYYKTNPYIQYVLGGQGSGICSQGLYYSSGHGSYSSLPGSGSNGDAYFGSGESDIVGNYSIYTTEANKVFRNSVAPALGDVSFISGISISCIGTKPSNPYFSYQGDIAEIVLYGDTLSNPNRLLAEGYLRCKYSNYVDLGADTIVPKFCVNVNLQAKATLFSSATFTSYLWSTGATTSSINATAFGSYWVTAIDLFGYKSVDTVRVRPVIDFNQLAVNTNLCKYDSVVWNTNYPTSGYQFTWSNGSTASSLVIKSPGIYYVKIKDSYGCYFYSDTVHIFLDSFPDFKMVKDTSFCSGNRLNFNYPGPLNSIIWSTNDTSLTPVITTPGSYWVMAVNSNGCKVRDTTQVFIKGIAPQVNFTFTTPCLGDTIIFTDSSQAPTGHSLVAWKWNFDNVDTSSLEDPTYVFPSFGVNTVSLIAITDSGCANTITKSIQVNFKPQPYFLSKIACAEAKTQFTDYSSTTPPAYITNWDWQFGTGDSSTAKNPVYSFPSPGTYNVSLKITNSDGCSAILADSLQVFTPLAANFSVSNVCIGDSTSFQVTSQSFSIVEWLWNFGDGSTLSSVPNPKHIYATSQVYSVGLTIENAIGCIDSITKPVNIVTYPTAAFGNLYTCVNASYTPIDSSISPSEPIANWTWNIDSAIFNIQAPQYTFTDTGSYPVKLTVTTLSGCQDSITHIVYSVPHPYVAFTSAPLYGDAPVDVTFINLSSNADFYSWNFGDSSALSNEAAPQHTYTQNGTYQITLVAASGFGCTDSASGVFIAMPTYLDLSVDEVDAVPGPTNANGTTLITVTAKCSNLGTRPITEITFFATLGSGGVISEDWTGLLPSGHRMDYTFNAKFVTDSSTNSYVCVLADSVNNGETETRTDNNEQCGLISGTIELIGPYPNPASDQAYLGIVLQQQGQVTIDVTDMWGRFVISDATLSLPVGITNYVIPANKLSAGQYLVRLEYNDNIFVKKFMVK